MIAGAGMKYATVRAAGTRAAAHTSPVARALPSQTWWRVPAFRAWLAAIAAAGCSYPPLPNTIVDGAPGDSVAPDSGPPPASPLLLSEVVLTLDAGEMIEIVNTSAGDINLSTYYLSDSGNYYRLPVAATVDTTDFIVKFPNGP